MEYVWNESEPACPIKVEQLAKEVKISPLIASLLVQRGISTFQEAERFFRPKLSHVNDPFLFVHMKEAVDVLNHAITNKKHIRLFGDYDVDGTTAVAIVMNALRNKVDSMDYYIPDRYTEGYGLSEAGVEAAIRDKVDLLITLDCGVRSVELIQTLISNNIQVIVCDHHEPGETLPPAIILDPKVPSDTYPFEGLSGAGVGMKLLEALFSKNGWPLDELYKQLDLLALSIAADIVPVTDENRVYAFYGLKLVNENPRPAFKKMLTSANRSGTIKLNDLVFGIAPRINAAGRIRSGRTAVACMLNPVHEDLDALIEEIEKDNQTRKSLDQQITEEALTMLAVEPTDRCVNVLYSSAWHKGVVGIVASRVIEKYPLPTIILTEHNGVLSGSARTVGNFDIHKALIQCESLLIQFGGHQHAAGLSLHPENFEDFKSKLNELAARYFESNPRTPILTYDATLNFDEIFCGESLYSIPKLVRVLDAFEPHGPGNHKPVFRTQEVYATQSKLLKALHLKLTLTQQSQRVKLNAIGFNMKEKEDLTLAGLSFDVLHTLDINEFNNRSTVQLVLKDLQPS
ncbi:MAG: single-stranded-DNA-specific exonuclease RecJ [Flavobacteriales bacterium]|jgi:single-stranded-DNA-specific exonuclease